MCMKGRANVTKEIDQLFSRLWQISLVKMGHSLAWLYNNTPTWTFEDKRVESKTWKGWHMSIIQPGSNDKTTIIPIHHFPQKIIFLIALPDSQGSCIRHHRSDLIISKHNSIGERINWKNFWRSGIVDSYILIWWTSYHHWLHFWECQFSILVMLMSSFTWV